MHTHRYHPWLLLVAAFAALALAGAHVPTSPAAAQPAAEGAATYRLYLPVLSRSPGQIFGRVTENGASAARSC